MERRSFTDIGTPTVIGRTIEGYAAVFNHESRVLYDKNNKRFFTEVIERGAITEELLKQCDIKAVLEHDRNRLLARSNKGVGSLSLTIDEYGLKYRFDAPNTAEGNFAVEMIGRGDLFGSSFCYFTNERNGDVTYSKKGDMIMRTVHTIAGIVDVSPVSDPAFTGTDITVRSMQEYGMIENDEREYLIELYNLRKQI